MARLSEPHQTLRFKGFNYSFPSGVTTTNTYCNWDKYLIIHGIVVWTTGTSMSSLSTCLEPQCQSCDPHEYQDKHTKESKCQRQPFCDPSETPWPKQRRVIMWPSSHLFCLCSLSQIYISKIPGTTTKKKLSACAKRDTTVPLNDVTDVKNTVSANRDMGLNLKVWLIPPTLLNSFCWCSFLHGEIKNIVCLTKTMTGLYCSTLSGTHSKDTVCEKCPLGTYSNETTASRECKKWTE